MLLTVSIDVLGQTSSSILVHHSDWFYFDYLSRVMRKKIFEYAKNKCTEQVYNHAGWSAPKLCTSLCTSFGLVSMFKISRLELVVVAGKACLCLNWSVTPKKWLYSASTLNHVNMSMSILQS